MTDAVVIGGGPGAIAARTTLRDAGLTGPARAGSRQGGVSRYLLMLAGPGRVRA